MNRTSSDKIARNGPWLLEGTWGGRRDLNPQQPEPQSGALPLSYDHHRWHGNRSLKFESFFANKGLDFSKSFHYLSAPVEPRFAGSLMIISPGRGARRVASAFLVGLFLLLPVPLLAQQDDPSEIFLKAYLSAQQGEKLEHENRFKTCPRQISVCGKPHRRIAQGASGLAASDRRISWP